MRITDSQISKYWRKKETWKWRAFVAVVLEIDNGILQFAVRRVAAEERNKACLQLRRSHIQACIFNLNSYFEQQYLIDFRLKLIDIAMHRERFKWPAVTHLNDYLCRRPQWCVCISLVCPNWQDGLSSRRSSGFLRPISRNRFGSA